MAGKQRLPASLSPSGRFRWHCGRMQRIRRGPEGKHLIVDELNEQWLPSKEAVDGVADERLALCSRAGA